MKMREATAAPCTCGGIWQPGARRVLELQGEDIAAFCSDVVRALNIGARRGANMALIGGPGVGKSMLLEPFHDIFEVFGKPALDNPYAFGDLPTADVMVWQDFRYSTRLQGISFEDLLSLLVGESVNVRVFRGKPVTLRNKAPLFMTACTPVAVVREDPAEMRSLSQAAHERFKTRHWNVPLPFEERRSDFPACKGCCARFYMQHAVP